MFDRITHSKTTMIFKPPTDMMFTCPILLRPADACCSAMLSNNGSSTDHTRYLRKSTGTAQTATDMLGVGLGLQQIEWALQLCSPELKMMITRASFF